MIRYEYDDDADFPDHALPRMEPLRTVELIPEVKHENLMDEADWLTVEPFNSTNNEVNNMFHQDLINANSRDGFSLDHYQDSLQLNPNFVQEDFHDLDAYIHSEYAEYPAESSLQHVTEENKEWFSNQVESMPASQAEILRERDANLDSLTRQQTVVVEKPRKKIKQPVHRRPIDEFQTKNGFKKPAFSYSCLIGLALKNSHTGEMTVSEIYRFLCEYFPFFREAPSGWKNSVRHNLSLNKCFEKVETEVADSQGRKSCLWRLNPLKVDKMAAEITKWRERCEPTIDFAMDDPSDLEHIINGTKGLPPPPENQSPADDEWYTGPKARFVNRKAPMEVHIPAQASSKVEVVKSEADHFNDENQFPSTSRVVYQPAAPSAHQKAARTLETLLEKKKQATTMPLNSSTESEPSPPPVRRPLSIHTYTNHFNPGQQHHEVKVHRVGGGQVVSRPRHMFTVRHQPYSRPVPAFHHQNAPHRNPLQPQQHLPSTSSTLTTIVGPRPMVVKQE